MLRGGLQDFSSVLNIPSCPKKKQGKKSKRQSQYIAQSQNTLHVGAAVSYCAIRWVSRPDKPRFQCAQLQGSEEKVVRDIMKKKLSRDTIPLCSLNHRNARNVPFHVHEYVGELTRCRSWKENVFLHSHTLQVMSLSFILQWWFFEVTTLSFNSWSKCQSFQESL